MSARPGGGRFARFGVFEADLQERTLHRNGLTVKLQNQPFEVLAALLERPGETVTGEELSRRVWPKGTYVEFEHSLSTAILKIRRALDDSAENPRFIETIPRHGYRFIAPVELVSESRFAPGNKPSRGRQMPLAVPLAVLAAVAIAAVYLVPRGMARDAPPTPRPLTTTPGWEHSPSFSPDGTQIAYTWCEEGAWELRGNCDIFVRPVGSDTSEQLTDYPWVDGSPAWSPDGRHIAFVRTPPEGMTTYLLMPATSGRERTLVETFPARSSSLLGGTISWLPDGAHLAIIVRDSPDGPHSIALLDLDTGTRRALTSPAPNGVGDSAVAVSPDGRRMAFARTGPARMPLVDIYVAGLSGEIAVVGSPRRLLAGQAAPVSLEWTPDGRTLVFSSGGRLWRMSADAGGASVPEPLTFATGYVMGLALSRDGRRLVYSQRQLRQNIRRVELTGLGMAASAPGELFPSTREDSWPQYAPDGSRVAFLSDRSGTRQIYVCDADGSNPRRLTALAGGVERPYPGWSPDGRQIVFAASVAGRTDLYVIDARGGAPSRLSYDPSSEYHPQWSRDGKWIYFGSDRNGESEVWKMPSAGGEAVRVTEHGGEGPFESPDGRHLYYFKAGAAGAEQLWRRLLPGGDEHLVLPEVFRGNFAMAGEYVYFVPQQDVGCGCYHLQRLDTTTGEVATLMALNEVGGGLSVSSDGRSLLYTTVLHTNADLMLVDGVR